MRLLILTPQFPYPPHQGTTIRNYNLIRQLAPRHEIDLLSFVEQSGDVDSDPLKPFCASICTIPVPQRTTLARARDTLFSPLCDMALRLESQTMHRQLAELMDRADYDVVQVEGIEMGPYLLQARQGDGRWRGPHPEGGPARPFLVFDDHNCEYLLQQRAYETDAREGGRWLGMIYSYIQWKKLARYERRCCSAADRVTAVSRSDGRALRDLLPGLRVSVVPNGVDSAAYDPRRIEPLDLGAAPIVFTGKMDFRPNVDAVLWFAQEVLPLVQNEIPEAHLYIVGQQPHRRLDVLRHQPQITITGFVDQPQPYIAAAAVYVVPMRMGGGTRLKVLEAMAMERAVVSTRLGCEGFPQLRADDHLLVADSASGFAQGVVALMRSPSRRQALGQAARNFVTQWYDWSHIVPRMEAIYPAT